MTAPAPRPHDLTLFGVTGYTGRLVAEELLRRARPGLRVALAGRDVAKLERIRASLADVIPTASACPLVVADVADRTSLARMAADTRAIVTTVGPYARYGTPLVEACIEAGTDACDLTGETTWIRTLVDHHHTRAVERGVRIVNCSGFDSVPSDLGVAMVQEFALRTFGAPCRRITNYFGETSGGASGGTIASMLGIIEALKRDPSVRKILGHPYALDPEPRPRGPDGGDALGVGRAEVLGQYTAPFFMAPVNTRVVRRSHALLGRPWGEAFSYRELQSTGAGIAGFSRAAQLAAAIPALFVGLSLPALGPWIAGKLPAPGEGPTPEQRARGYFVARLHGELDDGRAVYGRVSDTLDPGYGSTARMMAQVGLALVEDPPNGRVGVLTPSTALGMPLVERLRAVGMRWEVATTPDAVWQRQTRAA
jgi:short subunit dehydrogenase-like uncharacterized protein